MSDVRRVAVLLFAVAWGANHFAPLLLVYRARMHLLPIELSELFAVYSLGLVPGLLIGGPLSDTRGRRAVVLPAALLALGGTALLAAGAAGFGLLLAGRLVVGLGSGGVFSAGTAWLQDLSVGTAPGTGARRAAIALSCGFGGGPLIAGAVGQWSARPMWMPYLLQGAALCGALLLVSPAPGAVRAPGPAAPRSDRRSSLRPPAGFVREVGLVAPWVFAFPAIAFVVLPSLVRPHVAEFAVVYAGLVAAATLAAGILIQPLVRVAPPRRAAIVGLLVGVVGLLVGRLATSRGSAAGVVMAAVLLGFGYGGCLIAGLRWVEGATPLPSRGRVTGLFYVVTYVGFWAPLLLAALARRLGDGPPLLLAALLALATAVATGCQRWRTDPRSP